ncbi:hypothetical protein ACWF94_02060 [Streptomyces sp. NPDC055078]
MSELYGQEPEGWPCLLSEDVDALLKDLSLSGDVFAAIVAATVQINETRGMVEFTDCHAVRVVSELH